MRRELLETALPFYEEFVRQNQEDPDLEFERGCAYDDLGFLRHGLGDVKQAASDFGQPEALFRRLSEAHPGRPTFRHGLQSPILEGIRSPPADEGLNGKVSMKRKGLAAFRLAVTAVTRVGLVPEAVRTRTRPLVLLVAASLATWSSPVRSQTADDFAGNWINVNPEARGLTRIVLTESGGTELIVHP